MGPQEDTVASWPLSRGKHWSLIRNSWRKSQNGFVWVEKQIHPPPHLAFFWKDLWPNLWACWCTEWLACCHGDSCWDLIWFHVQRWAPMSICAPSWKDRVRVHWPLTGRMHTWGGRPTWDTSDCVLLSPPDVTPPQGYRIYLRTQSAYHVNNDELSYCRTKMC